MVNLRLDRRRGFLSVPEKIVVLLPLTFIGCRAKKKKKKQLCKLERELPHSTNKHIHKERKNESEEKGKKRKLIKPKAEEEYNALPCLLISRKLLALCL